jgi:putative transposase
MTDHDAALSLRFFDATDEVSVVERHLPHWAQSRTLCFLTWRTWDSIPREILGQWVRQRASWLARHGIDPTDGHWRDRVRRLPSPQRREFLTAFSDRWQGLLDECHGECVLRRPGLSGIVADSLRHFDGTRYTLTDFVIMPNHVHVLAAFPDEGRMLAQCESWKHFTAVRINKALGRTGRFWQEDGFDHLIRTAEQFAAVREYIAMNPVHAQLRPGEFRTYSCDLAVLGIRNE